jgi:hypothetical protein
MRLDFASQYDGRLQSADRPPADIAFVVDVSGSMALHFPGDSDRRHKLAVAVDCVKSISDQLQVRQFRYRSAAIVSMLKRLTN